MLASITLSTMIFMLSSHNPKYENNKFVIHITKQYNADNILEIVHNVRNLCHCAINTKVGDGLLIIQKVIKN